MDETTAPELSPDVIHTLGALVERMDHHRGLWGGRRGGEKRGENGYTMPYIVMSEVASDAMNFLYDHGLIVPFNWSGWDEGREIFQRTGVNRFDTLDQITVLKLLTAVARNDRFNNGAWVGIFESGSAQQLFRRLLELNEEKPFRS